MRPSWSSSSNCGMRNSWSFQSCKALFETLCIMSRWQEVFQHCHIALNVTPSALSDWYHLNNKILIFANISSPWRILQKIYFPSCVETNSVRRYTKKHVVITQKPFYLPKIFGISRHMFYRQIPITLWSATVHAEIIRNGWFDWH
jgi:hypothetical protein